jgi:hypothetical protein
MTVRVTASSLFPVLALAVVTGLAGCSGDPAPTAPTPTDAGVVHVPTSAPATTDSAGHPIEPLPPPSSQVAMSSNRVRGIDYSYLAPVGWSRADRELDPPPDTLVQPDDSDVPAFIAVERPINIGSHSLVEVVDGLRKGFEDKGFAPMAAPEREVAGYDAMGIVVDQSQEVRHVYYVVAYTENVYRAVLDSWSWG